jgi:hypothetical protein
VTSLNTCSLGSVGLLYAIVLVGSGCGQKSQSAGLEAVSGKPSQPEGLNAPYESPVANPIGHYVQDGMLIAITHQLIYEPTLADSLGDSTTVRDLSTRLGPGLLHPLSGTGSITWSLSDGSQYHSHGYPLSVDDQVSLVSAIPEP